MIVEEEFKEMENKRIKSLHGMSADVIEVYSAPRATTEVKKFGTIVDKTMGIIIGWDFNKKNKVMKYIGKHKRRMIIGSPMCEMFSQVYRTSRWNTEKEGWGHKDQVQLKFMTTGHQHQVEYGQRFLHEH